MAALHAGRRARLARPPPVFLRYGDRLADWRSAVARIGRDLGIAWPGLGTEAEGRVDAVLHGNDRAEG